MQSNETTTSAMGGGGGEGEEGEEGDTGKCGLLEEAVYGRPSSFHRRTKRGHQPRTGAVLASVDSSWGAFFASGRPSLLATRMDETDQNAFTPEGAPGTSKQGQRGPVQQGKTKVSGRASEHAGGVSINMNTCISSLSK